MLETVSLLPPNDPVSNVHETRALPFFFPFNYREERRFFYSDSFSQFRKIRYFLPRAEKYQTYTVLISDCESFLHSFDF